MSWYEKLLEVGKDVAPTLAGGAATTLSGGNIGAGALVSSIVSKVVGQKGVDLEEASEMILSDPNKVMEFRSRMRDAEIKELEIRTKDVQSARQLVSTSKGPIVLSTIVTVVFALILGLIMFVSIPAASQAVAYILVGTLGAAFSQVINFWLGTSLSSKDKDATIQRFSDAAKADQETRRQQPSGLYNNIKK
tara:strand:+ start:32790 stop:33365 length:576 start_codon:yes stop_codon:yes gene_type:complete